ncbi:unnamed protein product [Adineta ricciae]|uniref:Glutaredoxin domain-containing protein n=1 Tax=Adineta ricciae TaxID=249248 RepID=A0A814S4V0_ADIRI|nr:unnamed protein product [Adineta ricciae]
MIGSFLASNHILLPWFYYTSDTIGGLRNFVKRKMSIKVYITSITSNQLTIGNQRKLKHILDTNKIDYIDIDISDPKNTDEKEFLQRTLSARSQKLTLPYIFNDDQYCCDFDGLISAVESNTLHQTLQLEHEYTNNGH